MGLHVTAKHIQDFFHRKMKVFCSMAGIQGVTNEYFREGERKGLGMYTIIQYIKGEKRRGGNREKFPAEGPKKGKKREIS